MPVESRELDWRPLLQAVLEARARAGAWQEIARAFHAGLARGVAAGGSSLSPRSTRAETVVLSGGVFQNELLLEELIVGLAGSRLAGLDGT